MTPSQAAFPTTPTSRRESATFFKRVRSLLVLGITVIGLLVSSSSALAGRIHVFGSTFAKEGSGPGQLKEPSGVAVNEVTLANMGDVYVTDTANNRVERFSSEGTELKGEFDGSATPAGSFSEPTQIAIDNSANVLDPSRGDVYVADFGHSVLDKFSPEGAYLGQIATGSGGEPLGEIYGVAIDPEGVVWVYQASGEIDNYSNAEANVFISSRNDPFEEKTPGFAMDSEDNLYVNRGARQIAKLNSAGEKLIEAVNPEENATAAAVDATDDVFIDEGAQIGAFGPQAVLLERFGEGHLANSHGVAIDNATDIVYASNRENGTVTVFTTALTPTVLTGSASNLTTSEGSATLNATVDPEGIEVSSCIFEYGPTTSYGSTAACEPEPGSVEGPVAVHAEISGLEVGRYHFRVLAANANGESAGADSTFIAGGEPLIFGQSLAGASVTTAKVSALLNPQGLTTTYQLQYGTTTAYGSSTPLQSAGDGLGSTGVLVTLEGLSPGTEYHARLLAVNALGSAAGPDLAFTTSATANTSASSCPNKTNAGFSPLLPDCRAYEAVSPGGGPGEVYVPEGPETVPSRKEDIVTELPMRAAAQGDVVTYVAEPGEAGGTGATGRRLGNQFIATRNSHLHRWDVIAVTPTIDTPEELPSSYNPTYEAFSADLSTGILGSNSGSFAAKATPAGPTPCAVLYARTHDGSFHALFTKTLTPGSCGSAHELLFAGGNAGSASAPPYSHLLLQTPAPLTTGAEESTGEGSNLYESVGGATLQVSVLPGGEVDANAVFGGASSETEGSRPDLENAISADGSRIFWTDLETERIYMRLNGTSTVAVSEGPAKYWSATPDGHYVFYSEGEKLLRYDTQTAEREELAGAGAGVQGVAGTSEDGAYVYFVASGALAGAAEARNCRTAQEEKVEKREKGILSEAEAIELDEEQLVENHGRLPKGRGCNLYVWHEGVISFVGALGALDNELRRVGSGITLRLGVWQPELGSRTAQVTGGGGELVFQSAQQLTAYDNSKLSEEGSPDYGLEVFVYDAASNKLTCVSCDPAGAPPSKEASGLRAGTYLPVSVSPTSMRRWSSTDGSRVFFDSSQPLSPQDSNSAQDVYEWEREGTSGCPTATSKWGGCISLLSGGDSSDLSFFVDASADGGDVFFTHRGQLAGAGRPGDRAELFDARVDGGFPGSSMACTGTGCQGVPPAAPVFATPSSATFNGVGNFSSSSAGSPVVKKAAARRRSEKLIEALRVCKKKSRKQARTSCEKRARSRYGAKKAKKSNRRAK